MPYLFVSFQLNTVATCLWKYILILCVYMWVCLLLSTNNLPIQEINQAPKSAISERNPEPSHQSVQHVNIKNKGQDFDAFAKILREAEVKDNRSDSSARKVKELPTKNKRIIFIPGSEFHLRNNSYLSPYVIHPHPFHRLITTRTLCPDFGEGLFLVAYVHTSPDHFKRRMTIRQTWGNRSHFSHPLRLRFVIGLTKDNSDFKRP